jgi:branched-chain amino acid transport system substrate-binding protein
MGLSLTCSAFSAAPIKVGGLFDLSGKAQNIGAPTRDVALMVIEKINRQGALARSSQDDSEY